jgi:3-hydroxybutyryl-CoA dehydrogenase
MKEGAMVDIDRIAVVGGGGTMGSGIAQVAATAGFNVTIVDVNPADLQRGMARINNSLQRLVKSGKLTTDQVSETLSRLSTSSSIEEGVGPADFVFESVVENLDVKQDVFRQLDAICGENTILATNTSQFAITGIASVTKRQDRVIGTHWFNPPPIMRLIEVVMGDNTSNETLATTLTLAEKFGKETIVCMRDSQGFVTARLSLALNLEAARLYDEGLATAEDINRACVLAFNHAMGPLDTLDLGGLDTTIMASEAMVEHFGDRFAPTQGLRDLVAQGNLGRKSGRGFREYEKPT